MALDRCLGGQIGCSLVFGWLWVGVWVFVDWIL